MDVTDIATEREDAHREAAIAAHLALRNKPARVSAEHCEMCDDEIPEARRLILPGVVLCVGCQAQQERMSR